MWIKAPDATLLNLNNGNEIKVEGKFVMLYLATATNSCQSPRRMKLEFQSAKKLYIVQNSR